MNHCGPVLSGIIEMTSPFFLHNNGLSIIREILARQDPSYPPNLSITDDDIFDIRKTIIEVCVKCHPETSSSVFDFVQYFTIVEYQNYEAQLYVEFYDMGNNTLLPFLVPLFLFDSFNPIEEASLLARRIKLEARWLDLAKKIGNAESNKRKIDSFSNETSDQLHKYDENRETFLKELGHRP